MNQYMKNHMPSNPESTIEMWKLREQAKDAGGRDYIV